MQSGSDREEEPSKIGVAVGKGTSGKNALKWTLQSQQLPSNTVYLIHVYPPLRYIPTPMGNKVPVSEVNDVIVKRFRDQCSQETEKLLDEYRRICYANTVRPEVCKVESDSIQEALVDQIFKLGLTKLVLGTSGSTVFPWAFKGEKAIPKFVAKHGPNFCTVLIVNKDKLSSVKQASEVLIPDAPSDYIGSSSPSSSQGISMSSNEIETARSSSHDMRQYASFQDRRLLDQSSDIALLRARTTPRLTNDSLLSDYYTCQSEIEANSGHMSPEIIETINVDDEGSSAEIMPETLVQSAMSYPSSVGTSTPLSVHRESLVYPSLDHEENRHVRGEADLGEYMPRDSSVTLLQSQLDEVKLSATRAQAEAAQLTRAVSRTEQIVENAKKMVAVKERERDEALREAELARFRSLDDARKLEEVVVQLTTASSEKDRLQKDLTEEVARHRETQNALEESRCRIEEYKSSLESANRRVEEVQERCDEALRRLGAALEELEAEWKLRKEAEERVRKESALKQGAMAALRRLQRKCTVYSFEELAKATDNFSESNKLGEGGYGPVYKGELQHTAVAIKVLAHEEARGRKEFEREVELLSGFHHPHIVMLLGACPEKACIVYEYMSNGSLQDRLLCKGGTPPLPWYVRFRICAEVAIAILYLHSSPEPIVHRDLKPANILLDHNYVSKISDVGIAKLVPDTVTSSVTLYKDTQLEGTMAYMDPEYLRTGVISRDSDVYALGIVMLQLLTGKPAFGVADMVEKAIFDDNFGEVLDRSAGDWPQEKATDLALLALECADPRRRNRPKLATRIVPVLQTFRATAAEAQLAAIAASAPQSSEIIVPDFLICPISQEIMRNPHIAADGYTYDYEAISHWLRDHETSPMTNMVLEHRNLIPNYAVRSAIQDWHDKMQC